ncbi:amidohydrolase [Nocardioides sp. GY 10113]|uniref:amidohydrolase family protein n=1 Tax=Nocardioides sp. GY 10113 TaxID=2569761 RepID=UPI0010A8CF3A|nr:amidohydrolase family protein [Nocardioides sp. GY 10113]TIC87526.1 amidohydrolase [Nocardioides sp. GY 10113]
MTDLAHDAAEARAFWERLGLPGLIDLHAHFLPPPIEKAVWREFDGGGELIGREWPIRYRLPAEDRVAFLREAGVRRFSTLPYAHKPGVAGFLNDWSRDFAAEVPEALRSATFYPEPEAADYVPALVADGVEIFKLHLQVGGYHLDDPLLEPVWGTLADSGAPIMVHAGSGPVGTPYTGPDSTARVLARHPRLRLVIAHMGSPECGEFLALAERYDGVHLDTSMAFTHFFAEDAHAHGHGYPPDLVPRLRDLQGRVVWGSDFPTLPFPYGQQLAWLAATGLGEDWLRDVCWHNALRLLGIPRAAAGLYPVD